MDAKRDNRIPVRRAVDQESFQKGQEYERGTVLLYIQALSKGQNPKLAGGLLRQEFCRAIIEDLVAGRHHETCER